MAATNLVTSTRKPIRQGASVMGLLAGTFVDTAVTYADAVAIVQPYFLPNPPLQITYTLTGVANTYSFIALGRVI